MAETPGTTVTSMSRHAGLPASIASNTALAMANTPGSPEDTTATDLTCGGKIERLTGAGQLFAIVGFVPALAGALRHAGEIRRIADEVGGGGKRLLTQAA